jgi:transposase-like protein
MLLFEFGIAEAFWLKLTPMTSNALERFFREFRNKADEIGAFPNQDSCLTLFFLILRRCLIRV